MWAAHRPLFAALKQAILNRIEEDEEMAMPCAARSRLEVVDADGRPQFRFGRKEAIAALFSQQSIEDSARVAGIALTTLLGG